MRFANLRLVLHPSKILILLSLSYATPAGAQSLAQLLELALQHNQEIAAAKVEIQGAEAERRQTTALMLPRVGIAEMGRTMKTHNWIIQQAVDFPTKYYYRYQAADAGVERARAKYAQVEWQVRSELKKRYYMLLTTQKRRELTRANWNTVQELARAAEKRYASGRGGKHEAMQAHVELTRLDVETLRLDNLIEEQRFALWQSLNGELAEGWKIPEQKITPPSLLTHKWNQLKDPLLIHQAPVWQEEEAKVQMARHQKTLQRWTWTPDFEFSFQQYAGGQAMDSYQAMVTMSVPLWFWGPAAMNEQASAGLMSAEYKMKETEKRLLAKTRLLSATIERAARTLRIYETSLLPQAQTSYQFAAANYRSSRGEFSALLQSEKDLYEVNESYLMALQNYVDQVADLEAMLAQDFVLW